MKPRPPPIKSSLKVWTFAPAMLLAAWLLIPLPGQAQTISLISTGAVWKYFAVGTNPPAGWQERTYDDGAWCSGLGKFGFGQLNEATWLNPYPDHVNPLSSAYFRHSFLVTNSAAITNLTARLLRDDGAVGYLGRPNSSCAGLPAHRINLDGVAKRRGEADWKLGLGEGGLGRRGTKGQVRDGCKV